MTPDAARELWVRFVSGEALPAADQAALVAALDADPALRAELLEDVQFDGALRAMGDARRSGAAFAASVGACLEPERDATRFVRKVEARLADLPPEPVGPGRDSRSNLPRISRRFHRRDAASNGWMAALAAACALFALLLISTVFSSKPARVSKPAPVAIEKAPAPVPPTPRPEPPSVTPPAEPKRLQDIRRELETLEKTPAANPEDRARRVDDLRKEREAIEKDMREEIERRRAAPSQPPPAPEGAPRPPAVTVAERTLADVRGPKVVRIVDHVYFVGKQTRVQEGHSLSFGEAIYTVGGGEAHLEYADRTRVVLQPGSTAEDRSDIHGQRLFLSQGSLTSKIVQQPAGQPMIFATPHAEATIVGTRIRLSTAKDPGVGTTLNVDEGKVRFQQLSDRAAVDVGAGQTSTASVSGRDLKPRISFPNVFTIRFAPSDAPKEKDVYLDSGQPFLASRGYGWDGSRDGQPVPNAKQPNGSDVIMGRLPVWKMDLQDPRMKRDDHKTSSVVAGWGAHAETWKIELPNGRYVVTVCVGDYTFEQGPHHVAIEGLQIVNRVMTKLPKQAHVLHTEEVEVTDGELNMTVGGYAALQKSVDTSKDTLINYLVIKRVSAK